MPDSALAGTWVSQSGEPQASLVLSANGTAVIEDVPGRVFQSATVSTSGSGSAMSVSGTGSWSRISDTQLGLGLNSGSAAGRWQPVSIVGWPWDLQLRIPYGDPGWAAHSTSRSNDRRGGSSSCPRPEPLGSRPRFCGAGDCCWADADDSLPPTHEELGSGASFRIIRVDKSIDMERLLDRLKDTSMRTEPPRLPGAHHDNSSNG